MKSELLKFFNSNPNNELLFSKNKVLSLSQSFFKSISLNRNKDFLSNNKDELLFSIGTLLVFFNKFTLIQCPEKDYQSEDLILFRKINNDTISRNSFKINEIPFGFGKQLQFDLQDPYFHGYITFNYEGTYRIKDIPKYITVVNQLIDNLPELSQIEKEAINEKENAQRKRRKDEEKRRKDEEKRLQILNYNQKKIISSLDKDGNGEVDSVEGNDFNILLKKHQKTILEIDRNYVKKFVKISTYLKDKKANIQYIFKSISDTPNESVLHEYVGILKNEVNTYHMLLANGLTMLVALIEDDLIIYEEIYESMDRLNIFDSQWEKDVSQKLTNIGVGLNDLMYEIEASNRRIVSELSNLTYATEEGFKGLNGSISKELQSIDSSIKFNNLLTGIQTYQMYKINKNTRSLRE